MWPVSRVVRLTGAALLTGVVCGAVGCAALANLNLPPSFTRASVSGDLVQGAASSIALAVTTFDLQDDVTDVSVDLSEIGGPTEQALEQVAANEWTFSGEVTPTVAGDRQVVFTAIDASGRIGLLARTVTVASSGGGDGGSNLPPVLSNPSVEGPLVVNQSNVVVVSVTAVDPDGVVTGVVADLSQIGGPSAQPLGNSGDGVWSITETVRPILVGDRTVLFEAIDDDGAIGTAAVDAEVTSLIPPTPSPPLPPPPVP